MKIFILLFALVSAAHAREITVTGKTSYTPWMGPYDPVLGAELRADQLAEKECGQRPVRTSQFQHHSYQIEPYRFPVRYEATATYECPDDV